MNKEEYADKFMSRAKQDIKICENEDELHIYIAGLLENIDYWQNEYDYMKKYRDTLQLENTINSYTEEHNMRHNSDLELDILKTQQKEFISYLEDKIYSIEPKGTGINYNCEYDSEEDYVMAMKEQSKLNTLKEILSKYREIIGVSK